MRVFVAGATGAIGVPTVRALVAGGHDVHGTTRRPDKAPIIEALGAKAVVMDALDEESVRRAVENVRPEAIVQLLTALPANGPTRESHLRATTRLRVEGTRNLVSAAVPAGVRRYVSESIVLVYGGGDRVFTEADPFAQPPPGDSFIPVIDALRALETSVLGSELEGIALRFGLYYGPTSGSTQFMKRMARRHVLRLPRGSGVMPWIHVEDAAAAVVAAVERGRAGNVYNIVDDHAESLWTLAEQLTEANGLPRPKRLPRWVARIAVPYVVGGLDARLEVSNEKAKRELGWKPRYPTIAEGLRAGVS